MVKTNLLDYPTFEEVKELLKDISFNDLNWICDEMLSSDHAYEALLGQIVQRIVYSVKVNEIE